MSRGCASCYAETLAHRNPAVLGEWGPGGTRVVASESYWHQPLAWDRKAAAAGERRRVFCASLADVFEDWPGPMVGTSGGAMLEHDGKWWEVVPGTSAEGLGRPITMGDVRVRLFNLAQRTPHLDWLVLTKRPENVREMLNAIRDEVEGATRSLLGCMEQYGDIHFQNLWIGASVEDQETADARIPHLLKIPAAVRFLSCEPLLGPIDLRFVHTDIVEIDALAGTHGVLRPHGGQNSRIDWVIVGGESGPKARPMHPRWARDLRDQCVASETPYFFKQWGRFRPGGGPMGTRTEWVHASGLHYGTGEHIRGDRSAVEQMADVGKVAAGRLLDGRTWDQFPAPAAGARR